MNRDIFVKLLQQRQFKAVRSILDVMNEVDIASLLSDLEDKELALAFRLIPKDKAAEVFANMDASMQSYLVEIYTEKELKELLDDLYMDDTVDILEELPANLVSRILGAVSPDDRVKINELLNYPDDSAGSITEEHTGGAVLPVHHFGHGFCGNDQSLLCPVPLKETSSAIQCIDKSGTSGVDVKSHALYAQVPGNDTGHGRRNIITADGGTNHKVQLLGVSSGIFQGSQRGLGSQL